MFVLRFDISLCQEGRVNCVSHDSMRINRSKIGGGYVKRWPNLSSFESLLPATSWTTKVLYTRFLLISLDGRIVYKRYASLYFICGIDEDENELAVLDCIHRFVETLDAFFGTVCEIDVIFGFQKTHYLLDEFILAGEVLEPSMHSVLKAVHATDAEEAQQKREKRKIKM